MKINPPELDFIPQHIAIIMDGNGRWAKKNGFSRIHGHQEGAQSLRTVLRAAKNVGIKFVTVYAFSTENWKRTDAEIKGLMGLLVQSLKKYEKDLHENKTRLHVMGQINRLPISTQKALKKTMEETKMYKDSNMILALSYGGRAEIVNAMKLIAKKIKNDVLSISDINEDLIGNHLYLPHIPDPDMIIRSSGEKRLSNFMLWQLSYSEIIVVDTLWPDFKEQDFYNTLIEYNSRNRRFGNTTK